MLQISHKICALGYNSTLPSARYPRPGHSVQPVGPYNCQVFACKSSNLDDLIGGLDVPDLHLELADYQAEKGAVFTDDGIPYTFGQDALALEASQNTAAVVDRSHWGRLRFSGPDASTFLHNQTTADIASLQTGTSCDTVIVSPQGRSVDLSTCLRMDSGIILILSPGMAHSIKERMEKYITPFDKVSVFDITDSTRMFSLLGPASPDIMAKLAAPADLLQGVNGTHRVLGFKNSPVVVIVGSGLSGPGYTVICEENVAADIWQLFSEAGAVPMGDYGWEVARVLAGRPAQGAELSKDYNPLEAGLYNAVSLAKGCYMGQEALAKIHTQDAVKQQLFGLTLAAPCSVGDAVEYNGVVVGRVTSYVDTPRAEKKALAYIRRKVQGGEVAVFNGAEVIVNGVKGHLTATPFSHREFPPGAAPLKTKKNSSVNEKAEKSDENAELARQEKLKKMQERLAAWQSEQQK